MSLKTPLDSKHQTESAAFSNGVNKITHMQLFTKSKYECKIWIVKKENTLIAIIHTDLVRKHEIEKIKNIE